MNGIWPSLRFFHGLTGAGSKLYLFGGYAGSPAGQVNDLWAFSATTSTWAQLASGAPGPSARARPGFASSGGVLYLLGGFSLRDLWAYDPAQDAWSNRNRSVEGAWPRSSGGGAGGLLDVAGELFSVNMQSGAGIATAT